MHPRTIKKIRKTGLYVGLVLIVVCLLFPVYWGFLSSVTSTRLILSKNPPFFLKNPGFDAYGEIIERRPVFRWLFNTFYVSFFSTFLGIIVSLLAGYSLSRFDTAGNKIMGFFLLLSRMLPASLLVIPIYMVFSKAKMINSLSSLILMNLTNIIPFSTWMMKGFFDTIPKSLEEAANIDGCTWFQSFRKVVLPLTKPGVAAVSIYSMILCWNEFLYARTLAYKDAKWTFTVGLSSFIGENSINWNQIMAGGIIFLLPLIIVFIFLEPYLVGGMASGSVKG